MENLDYHYGSYVGNQVTRIDDAVMTGTEQSGFTELTKAAGEYVYDKNKGISGSAYVISYNHLNLPQKVQSQQPRS